MENEIGEKSRGVWCSISHISEGLASREYSSMSNATALSSQTKTGNWPLNQPGGHR